MRAELRRITPRKAGLFFRALCVTMIARAGLLFLPLAVVRRVVRCSVWFTTPVAFFQASPGEVIHSVVSAARRSPIGTTCLASALTGQALLKQRGYEVQLRIGVRREPSGAFGAHAWLERDGKVLIGGSESEIQSFTRMPEMEHLIV